jgi:glycosyltransferase involved in cell wall biosynthesis
MAPLVTVILPCYNVAECVGDAVDSLLRQSYSDLQILALDDGSIDATAELLDRFAQRDPRVTCVSFAANRGLISTLNEGLDRAQGDFIARMDADDISGPDRLSRQIAFLQSHPDISVLGTATHLISADTGHPLRPHPVRCVTAAGARFMSLLATPVAHPTIVIRRNAARGYRYGNGPSSLHAEDYELFARMISDGVNFSNLERALVTRRVREAGASISHEAAQIANFVSCARNHLLREAGIEADPGVHKVLVNRIDHVVTEHDVREGLDLLHELASEAVSKSPEASSDIWRVAKLQEADILIQALIRGSLPMKLSVPRLARRHLRAIGHADLRRYWLSKLRSNAS